MSSAVLPRSTTSRSTTMRPFVPAPNDMPGQEPFPELLAANMGDGILVLISGLSGLAVQVLQPFYVRIDRDADGFIAQSPISLVYEMGETWQEALQNYVPALIEHFEWLTEIEHSLSRSVRDELTRLREYLWLKK